MVDGLRKRPKGNEKLDEIMKTSKRDVFDTFASTFSKIPASNLDKFRLTFRITEIEEKQPCHQFSIHTLS